MIDLHLHTNMSDGSDSPLELLDKVVATGCKIFSVTDHDDLRANFAVLSIIKEKKCVSRFITGCEISAVFENRNLHLLCYGFDHEADSIKEVIAEGANLRRQRITFMFDHLRLNHGIIIPDKDKTDILNRKIPGKVHITDAAMKLGINMTRQEFFDRCLDDMESREFKISAEQVIKTVSKAGGVVSFAHPIETQKEYGIDFAEISMMAERLKEAGLSAIEVYHSAHGEKEVAEYTKIASRTGLLASGGSDYHGKNKAGVEIGKLTAYGYVPEDNKLTILKRIT